MTPQITLLIGALSTILLAGALILWFANRRYKSQFKAEQESPEKASETAFIINAFHEVTKQLKDKEKELVRLKALAEQRAETSESYNANVLQCVTNGVMTFDSTCVLTTINRAAEEILGSTFAPGTDCSHIFASDSDIARMVHTTLTKKKGFIRMETMLERPEGRLWLGYATAVLTDKSGDPLGVILSFSDLTEVKRLQEQMELKERLTALGEMSAGIAHELRNPMAVISGYLKILAKKTNPENQKIIEDITTEINGMNRIIGDLLTFARPASLNRSTVNMKELLEGCIASTCQAMHIGSNITIIQTLDEKMISVDEVLMRQACTNIIQNAVEAMSDGGTLTIHARPVKNEFHIDITDTGPGIPAPVLKKIFLPFFTTRDNGVGLGLALAHKIVLSHGGRIEVTSTEGKGSTFTMILPNT
ncbi:MAG: ATP-binding protein [Nitrospirota bacterium]